MIDPEILEERGITAKGWKKWLAPDDKGEPIDDTQKGKIAALKNRIRDRIMRGQDQNFSSHKVYYALDLAWDTPFRQINPTLIQGLFDPAKKMGSEEVSKILTLWGVDLSTIFIEEIDPKTNQKVKRVDIPSFFNVFVPLVRPYVTMRWAKIMNDRNRNPLFVYEPATNDTKSRMQCDAITHRVGAMTNQYGYFNVLKQCVFQMLHYSRALQFPEEEWHTEEQETGNKELAVKDEDGKPREEKGRMYRIVREGVRYHIPHPTRTFFDEAHRPSTFNTDTGCDFAGYWRVMRYRDVKGIAGYYNTDKITVGDNRWANIPSASAFFATVYPCVISWPVFGAQSDTDRETKLSNNYYGKDQMDASVVITEYFEKLIPSECGLGDYDYPIWARFVIAGDDTIIYAAPLCYRPVTWYGYDTDEARDKNASLSLEILPFQDQFSNLLTQYLLSVRQNLVSVSFVDTDPMGTDAPSVLEKIRNFGERMLRSRIFIPFSGRKAQKSQHSVPQVFHQTNFAQLDTQSIVQAMKVILDTLERVLVMSSQEVAQAATHEQTKAEVTHISDQTSTRLAFTATPVDQGMEAWKQQLYEALMAHGSDDFYAQIPNDPPLDKDALEKLGFTWDAEDSQPLPGENKIKVKVKKSAIDLVSFTIRRDSIDRISDPEAAVSMLNALEGLLNGPLGPAIGPDQALKVVNLAAKMAGFPKEFKLENKAPAVPPEQQQAQQLQQLQQFSAEVLQHVKEGMVPILQELKKHDQQIQQIAHIINPQLAPMPEQQQASAIPPAQPDQTQVSPGMAAPTGVPAV